MTKTANLLKASAIAAALLPLTSIAAIDDQGMQYVSAAEGLHGSMRVNIWQRQDNGIDNSVGGSANSLRLWVVGTADIGGGMSSTYYWEVRQGSGGVSGEALGTEAWDLGITGSFGSVNFGKLGMVAPRLVPGGSLDTVQGSNESSFAADPGVNGIRYESPTISGFQAGFSAVVNQTTLIVAGIDDSLLEEVSFAVKYTSPIGLQVGAGYEVETQNVRPVITGYDDKAGWRFGARYGQDNWLVAYEFRTYEGHNPEYAYDVSVISSFGKGASGGTDIANLVGETRGLSYFVKLEYQVHRAAVQVKVDRITASANYSKEEMKLSEAGTLPVDRSTLGVDVAYTLGSKSMIALGLKSMDAERYATVSGTPTKVNFSVRSAQNIELDETVIYYRVDF